MPRVSTYLNFTDQTEAAFMFYKSIFGGDFTSLQRFSDFPDQQGMEKMTAADKNGIMHIALPILGDHLLMGTDAPDSMGFRLKPGNNVYILLTLDTRKEADRLFNALSAGGKVEMPMQDMFWGDYYGSCVDKYGVQWMINCNTK